MDNAKKKRNKKYISWIALGLVVVMLAAMPLMAKSEVEEDGPVATVHSGTVEKGSVSTTLHGGGTLTTEDAEDVTIPSGVKITEFLVKNGDVVTEGTPVATVDKVSVMTAIVEVKETLEYLQEQIESVRNETVSSYVSATAGGRVKEVYAEAGDSVQDVMLRDGALAVLSLDGMMAVQIQRGMDIATGDSVTVKLSDDTEVTGRVESNLNGVITVTIEDEGYEIGEKVMVTTEDGDKVGTGELYIHNAWKATAFTGTVSAVYAKEESTVYSGSTLFTLKDTEFTAELEYLSNQHRDYEELMQDLFKMYQEGALTAPCDGVVSGVDEDSPFLLAAGEGEWELVPLTASTEEKGWTVMLLSAETPSEAPAPDASEPGTGDGTGEGETEGEAATYTGFVATVVEVSTVDNKIKVNVDMNGVTVTKKEDGTWDFGTLDTSNPDNLLPWDEYISVANAADFGEGDTVVIVYDENGNYDVVLVMDASTSLDDVLGGLGDITGGLGGITGGMTGGTGGYGDLSGLMGSMSGLTGVTGTTQETESELFDLDGDVLLTVTPQDTVSLTITLDEQDIAKVSVGQTAEVKVEALKGQTFEAEVTEVSISGTNSGGSSKFTAKLVMDYSENMLDGMSATASLPLYTKMDVLTIPVEALVEDGTKTVVCTALDKETGDPTSPVEVTVGASDGITAEILSGLQLGDTYYYSYYDVLELDTSAEAQKYSFG